MIKFNDNNEIIENESYRAILVGVYKDEDISYSMEELKGLALAVNAQVLGMMTQKILKANPRTLIGSGKVLELKEMVENMEADTVIFNDELTGVELRNLEEELGVHVIDKIYYHYWVNSESTVTSKNSLRHLDRIVIEEMLISKYEELGILNIYHNEIFSIFITRYYINTMHILFTRFDKIPLGIYERLRAFSFEHYGDEIIQLTKVLPPNDKTQLLMSFLVSNECASYDDLINLRSSYLKF